MTFLCMTLKLISRASGGSGDFFSVERMLSSSQYGPLSADTLRERSVVPAVTWAACLCRLHSLFAGRVVTRENIRPVSDAQASAWLSQKFVMGMSLSLPPPTMPAAPEAGNQTMPRCWNLR